MSGDDAAEMAALVADFGLSERGAQATKPPFSYLHAFFKAMAEPWEEGVRDDGYINLAVAQNFLTVDTVQERLRKAMAGEQPQSTAAYDNMRGSERLRVAMARVLAPTAGAGTVDPNDLCISTGCGAILDNLFLTITAPGDGVLIPAPYYPAFDNDLRVRNGTKTLPTPAQLDAAVAQSASQGCAVKALLLTNPSNPLGVVYTLAELTAAVTWALDKGLHVVVDEVYASSVYAEGASSFVSSLAMEASLPAACETRLHLVYGLSKDFCASGYRVGVLRTRNKLLPYAEAIIRAMDNVAYFCTVPGPMQYAVAEMLEDKAWVDGYLALNSRNLAHSHAVLSAALGEAGVPVIAATAGMFVWIDLGGWLKEKTWEEEARLWTACFEDPKCKLVMTPGRDCKHDVPGCFRMCFAAVKKEALPVAAKRLAALLIQFK